MSVRVQLRRGDEDAVAYLKMELPTGSTILREDGTQSLVASFSPNALLRILTDLMGCSGLCVLEDGFQPQAYWKGENPPCHIKVHGLPELDVGESSRKDGGLALICSSRSVESRSVESILSADAGWEAIEVPLDVGRIVNVALHIMRVHRVVRVDVAPCEGGFHLKAWRRKGFLRKVWEGLMD